MVIVHLRLLLMHQHVCLSMDINHRRIHLVRQDHGMEVLGDIPTLGFGFNTQR